MKFNNKSLIVILFLYIGISFGMEESLGVKNKEPNKNEGVSSGRPICSLYYLAMKTIAENELLLKKNDKKFLQNITFEGGAPGIANVYHYLVMLHQAFTIANNNIIDAAFFADFMNRPMYVMNFFWNFLSINDFIKYKKSAKSNEIYKKCYNFVDQVKQNKDFSYAVKRYFTFTKMAATRNIKNFAYFYGNFKLKFDQSMSADILLDDLENYLLQGLNERDKNHILSLAVINQDDRLTEVIAKYVNIDQAMKNRSCPSISVVFRTTKSPAYICEHDFESTIEYIDKLLKEVERIFFVKSSLCKEWQYKNDIINGAGLWSAVSLKNNEHIAGSEVSNIIMNDLANMSVQPLHTSDIKKKLANKHDVIQGVIYFDEYIYADLLKEDSISYKQFINSIKKLAEKDGYSEVIGYLLQRYGSYVDDWLDNKKAFYRFEVEEPSNQRLDKKPFIYALGKCFEKKSYIDMYYTNRIYNLCARNNLFSNGFLSLQGKNVFIGTLIDELINQKYINEAMLLINMYKSLNEPYLFTHKIKRMIIENAQTLSNSFIENLTKYLDDPKHMLFILKIANLMWKKNLIAHFEAIKEKVKNQVFYGSKVVLECKWVLETGQVCKNWVLDKTVRGDKVIREIDKLKNRKMRKNFIKEWPAWYKKKKESFEQQLMKHNTNRDLPKIEYAGVRRALYVQRVRHAQNKLKNV